MTPTFTRGPGEALGVFTLETAMDELASQLGIDPVELRLRNHTPVDPARPPVVQRRARRSACASAPSGSAGPSGTRRRARPATATG